MSLNTAASLAQLKASDPSATVWVNANAGSGKTHVLVDRVVRLMLGGTEPSRIMCLTFTKAAAAEMANRLFDRLSKWIALDDDALRAELRKLGLPDADDHLLARARQLFTRALETPCSASTPAPSFPPTTATPNTTPGTSPFSANSPCNRSSS